MKKLFFGLIAMVMVSITSFGQNVGLDYFSQLDPIKTAQIHNDVLSEIHRLQQNNPNLSIRDALLQMDLEISTEVRIEVYNYISTNNNTEQNYRNVLGYLETNRGREIYTNINNAIKNNGNYSGLVSAIDLELLNANRELSGFDLKTIQLFAETSKASANYWFNLHSLNGNTNSSQKAAWIAKDGNGIAQASVGWAIGAAFCGGGPLSYVICCGVGGALASVWP
jgi:hypothetical protein